MEVVEWLALLIIIGFQARAFWQGRLASAQLAAVFPASSTLRLTRHQDAATGQLVDVLLATGATPDFALIERDTNAYLLKNKGTADFDILQSIAERRANALDAVTNGATSLGDLQRFVEGRGKLRGFFAPTAEGVAREGAPHP